MGQVAIGNLALVMKMGGLAAEKGREPANAQGYSKVALLSFD
jgi:hypothetical protein